MYQALYRKYRPRCFRDVVGQEHVTDTLRRQIVSDRLSHAYLFVGTRGTGKTTCAKILSRAVNCRSPIDGDPCNACPSCLGIENGSILDVIELDAASYTGVDNVRALREEAIYSPAYVVKRVYIIDEVHMFSNSSFNALLKILEEPPEHLIFVLATTELHKVPATILSRCQRFSFKRLTPATIAGQLALIAKSEGITLEKDAREKLAALADGSMRDGISLLDQCASKKFVDLQCVVDTIGLTGQQELLRIAAEIADRKIINVLDIMDSMYSDGRDMMSLLNELAALMRDLLIFKLSPDSPLLSGGFSRKELSVLSKRLATGRLLSCLDTIMETSSMLSRGGSVRLCVESCLIRLSDERMSDDIPAILARIERLESGEARVTPDPPEQQPRIQDVLSTISRSRIEEATDAANNNPDLNREEEPSHQPDSVAQPKAADTTDPSIDDDSSVEYEGDAQHHCPLTTLSVEPPEPHAQSETDFWADILELLKNDKPVHAVLSDSGSVQARLADDALIIRASSPFADKVIETKLFTESLEEAAAKALGRKVAIRVEIGKGGNDESNDKLERLSAFDIIQFE